MKMIDNVRKSLARELKMKNQSLDNWKRMFHEKNLELRRLRSGLKRKRERQQAEAAKRFKWEDETESDSTIPL